MSKTSPGKVTRLLRAWGEGNQEALDQLWPIVYDELHRLATLRLHRERPGHTLQATALVNEAYLRLIDQRSAQWQNRCQFYAIAAQSMRRILVDYARRRRSKKRGGGTLQVSLGEATSQKQASEVLALHDALLSLSAIDSTKAQIVELRFFGGLSIDETAGALGISPATVGRHWKFARAWLQREMKTPQSG